MQIIFYEFAYRLITGIYFFVIKAAAPFHAKAKKWTTGRQNVFQELETAFAFQQTGPQPIVWFHCASLGEFEQGRSIIELLKKVHPDVKILLTFFSPSGYEIREGYPLADWVFYLPADHPKNAGRFIKTVKPAMAVFVKYEFWYYYLTQLKQQSIPTFLIAAVFREGQPFFQWYGRLHREMLGCFTTLFVQDEGSMARLQSIGVNNSQIAGDPRIDRVLGIAAEGREFPEIAGFCGNAPVLVAGSTWPEDEKLLSDWLREPGLKDWKLIIAPHDIGVKRVGEIPEILGQPVVLHSQLNTNETDERILLIDSIGQLAWIYQFGQVAYIGGGFGTAIHNTLEPMAFHLPVMYGEKYHKFVEAVEMVREGGHFSVRSGAEMVSVMQNLSRPEALHQARKKVAAFMNTNKGAAQTITQQFLTYL